MNNDNYFFSEPAEGTEPASVSAAQEEVYQSLLSRQQDMLTLFSGDQRLVYQLDRKGEHFVLRPSSLTVDVPLLFFRSMPYSQNRFLFHLYQTLALYPDWQKAPGQYLNRVSSFQSDADEMAFYFLTRVQKAGLAGDPAYAPAAVEAEIQDEIESFLEGCDAWVSVLTVLAKAPVYQNPSVKRNIAQMLLLEDVFPKEDNPLGVHRDLAGSLLIAEFYDKTEIGWPEIREALQEPVMGEMRYSFLRKAVSDSVSLHRGIAWRDPFLHTFLFPVFRQLWQQDVDRMALSATIEEEQQIDPERRARRKRNPAMTRADRRRMLQELKEQNEDHAKALRQLLSGEADLSAFGVTTADRELFRHYEQTVRPVREEMKRYWRQLIGEASREVNVRLTNMPKGSLNVDTLIRSWPAFIEAQQRQNYKELRIFDASMLRKVTKELPRFLDITFVLDNSGSMRSGKVEAAREALAAVLLSLKDFEHYLRSNAEQTHQRIAVRAETWLFGTTFQKVLSFDDTLRAREADTLLSITRLDGSGGTTDDGACLAEILRQMTPQMVREQLAGRRIRLIFEVTDGASSFPGSARKAVEELRRNQAHIQSIEIGSEKDMAARNTFQYVFGESGLFLGSRIDTLPAALMKAVRKEMTDIFRT